MTAAIHAPELTLLSPDHVRQYQEEGYTLMRGLIPPELMAAVKEELVAIMNGRQDGWDVGHFQFFDPAKYRTPDGKFLPGGVQGPAQGPRGEIFRAVADHPRLRAAMSDLLGGPVKRYTDQCLIKTAWISEEQGGRTYYHQDSYYWLLKPRAGCNVWIPCDRVGKDAIGLAIKPGTHREWTLVDHEQYYDDPSLHSPRSLEPFQRHRVPLDRVDASDEVLLEMEPGDGVFFTNFTWHRSEPNRTGRHLFAYAIAYQLAEGQNKYDADPRPKR